MGSKPVWWKASPGYGGNYWDDFCDNKIFVMGNFEVPGVGDLSQYSGKKELRDAGLSPTAASQLWLLAHEVRSGDFLVAYSRGHILGFGEVVGDYRLGEEDTYWLGENYVRDVDWKPTIPAISIHSDPVLWGSSPGKGPFTRHLTLVKLSEEHVLKLLEVFDHHRITAPAFVSSSENAEETLPLGQPYKRADENVSRTTTPFEVDPERIERGTGAHGATQNALYDCLVHQGIQPYSPTAGGPEYDLVWEADGVVFVAEVKSITDYNEDKQLRLGLGQVLWYRHLLAKHHDAVVAVLVAEREPTNPAWEDLCHELQVRLAWPGGFDRLLEET